MLPLPSQIGIAAATWTTSRTRISTRGRQCASAGGQFDATTRRRGVTLLELLIVMVILLMITAAAIPIVVPATRNRQMREATRLVTTYLGAAKARAVQTGRPAGVMIERFNGNAFALQISQVEVPPPYAGDTTYSSMRVGALPDKWQRDECNEQRRGTSSHHDSRPNSTGIRERILRDGGWRNGNDRSKWAMEDYLH